MADSIEEVNVGGKKTLLRYISYTKFLQILEVLRDSHHLLDPETVQLPAFSILSAMFTGACGPPERLSLALAPHSFILRMIAKLASEQPL